MGVARAIHYLGARAGHPVEAPRELQHSPPEQGLCKKDSGLHLRSL